MAREIIDTGIAGDETTGDNLFVGGNKINANFEQVFNAFGDAALDPEFQTVHATGYYQKAGQEIDMSNGYTIPAGSQLDVDTTAGPINVQLPKGKLGERIKFRDLLGAWSPANAFIVHAASGETILGNPFQAFIFSSIEAEFMCIEQTPSSAVWTFQVTGLTANTFSAVQNFTIPMAMPINIPLDKVFFNFADFKFVSKEASGVVSSSHATITHNDTVIHFEEDRLLNTNSAEKPYEVTFSIVGDDIVLTVNFLPGGVYPIDFALKLTETIKI